MIIGTSLDETIELVDNAMLNHRPELFSEWDFDKNNELGLDIYEVTRGSGKIAWWVCPKCESPYGASIESRILKKSNCPYCAGKRVNHTNSLASLFPELTKEWHPTKNGELAPHDVTKGRSEKVWWISECGHEWEAAISNRTKKDRNNCPYCSNQEILVGFNDMWTTSPRLASMLANLKDGYRYTKSSGAYVDWKCLNCENIIENKMINDTNKKGLSCPRCSDGIPFGEKFIYNLLREANIEFVFDESQDWSLRKRYDFYLPEYNWIIEVHGRQHYNGSFKGFKDGKGLLEEEDNDRFKEDLARENEINNYIVIDARESTIEWIRNSILNSIIMKIVRDVDFEEIGRLSSNSLVKTSCDLWNAGVRSTTEVGKIMSIDGQTIRKYLKRGAEIGWCDYDVLPTRAKVVIQLSKENEFIKEWVSATAASKSLCITRGNISSVCTGKKKTSGGFRWLYEEDYRNYLSGELGFPPLINQHAKKVVQLELDVSLIKTFNSLTEATRFTKVTTGGISSVCANKRKTAGGFKWMFKSDYDKMDVEGLTHEEYMTKYYPKTK